MLKDKRFLVGLKQIAVCILIVSSAFLVTGSGCMKPIDRPDPIVDPLVLVAGDATLQILDTGGNDWRAPAGLGLGANWVSFVTAYDFVVVNSISHSLQYFTVTSDEIRQVSSIDLGLERNASPYAAAAWGEIVYVTNILANTVSVVDLEGEEIVNEYAIGRAPEGILVDHDVMYVINSGYDFSDYTFHNGSVYKMQRSDGEILDTLALGMNPQFGVLTNGELHIVCTGDYTNVDGEVWIVDPTSLNLIDILEVGHSPGRITVGYQQDGLTAWIAAGGWSNEGSSEGLILSYNVTTREIYEPISANLGVIDVAFHWYQGSNRFYAVCRDAMKLDVFDNRKRIASYNLSDPPNALAVVEF